MVPRENCAVVVAEDNRSLNKKVVTFKPFYFPFFHLFCKTKICLHWVTPLH